MANRGYLVPLAEPRSGCGRLLRCGALRRLLGREAVEPFGLLIADELKDANDPFDARGGPGDIGRRLSLPSGDEPHQIDHPSFGDHLDEVGTHVAITHQARFDLRGDRGVVGSCSQRRGGGNHQLVDDRADIFGVAGKRLGALPADSFGTSPVRSTIRL